MESETKVRLRPFLKKYGLDFDESADASEMVGGIVALYQESSWTGFLEALKPMIDQYIGRFQEIASAGPAEDHEILQSMVTHEQSFSDWIEKELAGKEGSLDAAIGQLQHPLPAP